MQEARFRDALQKFWHVVVLSIELLAVGFAGLKLWDNFAPDPVLVYETTYRPAPGNVIAETHFRNVNKNWPLENISANWELESADVKLSIGPNAPHYSIDFSQPNSWSMKLLSPLPGYGQFSAFLQATHSFQIFRQEISAEVPRIDKFGLRYQKVEVLSETDWQNRNGIPYGALIGFVVVVILVLASGYKLFALFKPTTK